MAEKEAGAGLTRDDLKSILDERDGKLTDAITALANGQKTIADALAAQTKDPAEVKTYKPDEKNKPLTRDELLATLEERDTKRRQADTLRADRDRFVGDKLKDLPPAYQRQLGDDPTKWAAEEQTIRDQYKQDFGVANPGKQPPVNGKPPADAEKPAALGDPSKLPQDKFAANYLPKVPGSQPAPEPEKAGAAA